MENDYLYPETINIFNDKELEFRVSQINDEGTNVKEVFEANLVNYVFHFKRFPNHYEIDQTIDSEWIYDQYCKGQLYLNDEESIEDESPCSEFIRFEWHNFFLEGVHNAEFYINFIDNHADTYQCIDKLTNNYFNNFKGTDTFRNYAKLKLQNENINFDTIENGFYRLEKLIVKTAAIDLIQFLKFTTNDTYEKEMSQVFDIDYFLNPALIHEPFELAKYQEVVKAWLNKINQDLKYKLTLPAIPPIALWLIAEIENRKSSLNLEIETKDYPKYIFTNYKAFDLFDTLAKEMTTHPQISFLFRQMSEKEKPALIVVENSDFVKWFNLQNYNLTLDYPTKTLEQSKTDDRIMAYAIVKKLKISQ